MGLMRSVVADVLDGRQGQGGYRWLGSWVRNGYGKRNLAEALDIGLRAARMPSARCRGQAALRAAPAVLGVMSRTKRRRRIFGSRRAEHRHDGVARLPCLRRHGAFARPRPPRKTGLPALGVDFRGMPLLPPKDPVN